MGTSLKTHFYPVDSKNESKVESQDDWQSMEAELSSDCRLMIEID